MDIVTRPLKSTVRSYLLAAVLAPCAAISQAATELSVEREQQIIREIDLEVTQNGPYSEQLIEPLLSLSLLYDEADEGAPFEATIERLLQVVRANYGLYSLEQAPIIRQLVRRMQASGNAETAWALEQELLELARRHPDDSRSAQIFRETGDRRLELLRRYDAGERLAEIALGCYYDDSKEYLKAKVRGSRPIFSAPMSELRNKCAAGSKNQARRAILLEAQSYYFASADILLANEEYTNELRQALWEIVRSSARYYTPIPGRQALQLLRAFEDRESEVLLPRIEAQVRIADHDLLYSPVLGTKNRDSALAEYLDAYALLAEHGIGEDTVREMFAPEMPIVLPAFMPNPLVSPESPDSIGHIDIRFQVGADGKGSDIEVLDSSANASRAAARDLVETIKRSRFRPLIEDNELLDPATFTLRYYLDD